MRDTNAIDFMARQAVVVMIGPDLANELLARNTHNRPIRASHVAELAQDMRLGRWRLSHQGIAFDVHGRLMDGQHRLHAIVLAGVVVQMLVCTMVDAEANGVIDIQAKRSLADALALSGRDFGIKNGGGSVNTNAAMWRCMIGGLSLGLKDKATNEEIFRFMDAHRSAGEFVLIEFAKHQRIKSVHIAPVMAAVARSYYHFRDQLPKLQRFISLLCTGMGASPFAADDTVLGLRNVLINKVAGRNSNFTPEIYGKTASALIAFMQDRKLTKLYKPEHEPFPLPGETAGHPGRPDRMALDVGRSGAGRPRADRVARNTTAALPA